MHLSRVRVQNYRGLEALDVPLQSGLNVLIGRNNIGKTSLINAIRLALGPSSSQGENLWLTADDFHRKGPSAPPANTIAIELTFADLTESQRAFFYEIVDFDLANLERSTASIRFQAKWDATALRATVSRRARAAGDSAAEVPSEILAELSVTFLPALRDAQAQLAPGPRNRLARMLEDSAARLGGNTVEEISSIFRDANADLESRPLISEAQTSLRRTAKLISGNDYAEPAIRAVGQQFDRILRSLEVSIPGASVDGLHASGLGYNNLLFIAVVLEHLRAPRKNESPVLMVEEPEAHLHPQLTELLAAHLAGTGGAQAAPQTLISTHSPTLVSALPADRMCVLYTDPTSKAVTCTSLATIELSKRESKEIRRMLDVTRASLFFAKGLILVEGVSEQLLLPAIAKRLGLDLRERQVAVVPICGVAFEAYKKLLGPGAFGVPTAIVSDADPAIQEEPALPWSEQVPESDAGEYRVSARAKKLQTMFVGTTHVRVLLSSVTLEHDLALAGDHNAVYIARAWARCFDGAPRTLTEAMVSAEGLDRKDKALIVWRGVCRSGTVGSKAELSQNLAELLTDAASTPDWVSPKYLEDAIRHACGV